jgi:fido (protein-threonine AMPylation protein)
MSLTASYGETPVPDDDLESLLPNIRELLGEPVSKAAVYDLEQVLQENLAENLLTAVLEGTLALDELLTDPFVRDLHGRLYGDIWTWAGTFRRWELNIGVAPEHIAVALRSSLETIQYRWHNTDDWSPREVGVVTDRKSVV